ncbi:MAG: 5'/3'-nucleotidase SurE [Roseburia sp.]|nr:5'/3'-nucleotidase SurE [Roseburia sp.]MCM1557666.1 5'/3'-nucleotidase SurE [Anaeroplasma bactoclasticum]
MLNSEVEGLIDMRGTSMNILVVNDDGIFAIGLKKLAIALKKYGNVVVCAPDMGRSAAGHSIILHGSLTFDFVGDYDGIKWYKTSGTPADCVRLAMNLLDLSFDVVFSGINNGLNLGTDIIYSGTVAAAREANIEEVPAVALSTDFNSFSIVDQELAVVLSYIFEDQLYSSDYVLNINFPIGSFKESKGYRFCRQGIKKYKTNFSKTEAGDYLNADGKLVCDKNPDTDVYLASKGYITFVPLQIEQTKYDSLEKLKKIFENH